MGSLITDLFGGSKQKSSSSNQAYPWLQQQYGGAVGTGNNAMNALAGLLGVGGDPNAAQQGFQNYLNSDGYKFLLDSGSRAITGNAAARGLLQSGATGKALQQYGQNLGSTQFQNYLSNLSGLADQGLKAGGLIGGTGQVSSGTGSSSKGIGGFAGALLAGL